MDVYIPDTIIDDYERTARFRMTRLKDDRDRFVSVHANVLLGLINAYRAERKRELTVRVDAT